MTRAEGLGEQLIDHGDSGSLAARIDPPDARPVDLAAHALHMAAITYAGPRPHRTTLGEESAITGQILERAEAFEAHLEQANARAAERSVKVLSEALADARSEAAVTQPRTPGVA
jgi:hypothetical protein